jgi:hypothetical protein
MGTMQSVRGMCMWEGVGTAVEAMLSPITLFNHNKPQDTMSLFLRRHLKIQNA